MRVSELFYSIQGETSYAGRPCAFVRLAGCNLDCVYCDTRYAREGGTTMTVDEMVRETTKQQVRLVMVTGGEPLVQNETPELVQRFVAMGHTVLVETNGSLDIDLLPDKAVRIVDMKCPDSGMSDRMLFSNLDRLRDTDEVKFVISSRQDYLWAKQMATTYSLAGRVTVLFSPVYGMLKPRDLAGWILDDHLECILQLQLHKIIWSEKQRGV